MAHLPDLYSIAAKNVRLVLQMKYGLSGADAERAVDSSPLKSIFDEYGEMAAHISSESWAADVYKFWMDERKHK